MSHSTIRRLTVGFALALLLLSASAAAVTPLGFPGPAGPQGAAGQPGGNSVTLWLDHATGDLTGPTIAASMTLAFVNSNPDTITSTVHDFVALGFKRWQKITVSGSSVPGNNKTYTINSVAVATLTLISSDTVTAVGEGVDAITIVPNLESLTPFPSSGAEVDESVSTSTADTNGVSFDSYPTLSGVPNQTVLPAGNWLFHFWAYVSNAAGSSQVKWQVSKVTAAGVETELFVSALSADINATSYATATEIELVYTQVADLMLLATDRIMVRPIAVHDTAAAKTVHLLYHGTDHASHVGTTLSGAQIARALLSATTVVDVAAATAPSTGQVLTATGSTTATWQSPAAGVWADVSPGSIGCTRVDDDTVSVADTAANVALFRPGVPYRGADAIGTWRVAQVKTVTDAGATLTVDLDGVAITAAFDAYCQIGAASLVPEPTYITIPGQYADGAQAALLLTDLLWINPPHSQVKRYLVRACYRPITDDTGAAQSAMQLLINGAAAHTALTLSDAAWTCTSAATIDAATYDQLYGETIELSTDAAGSNDDAVNLSVVLTWVLEG